VIDYPFAKTKVITHQLVDENAARPKGWSAEFGELGQEVVLPGYTIFAGHDAQVAAKRMLSQGPIRLKHPLSCGGRAQTVVTTIVQVEQFIEGLAPRDIAVNGLVIEGNLREVTTRSIGQITINDMVMTYQGTQRVTNDNEGRSVYGGSDLVCVRGGWDALDELPMTTEVRLGIAQART